MVLRLPPIIEILWLAPDPKQMRVLVAEASEHGLQTRLTMTEPIKRDPNLDELW